MRAWLALALLAACRDDTPGDTTSGSATGTTATGGASASCAPTDNALRFACAATVPEAAAGTWTIEADGRVVRTFATASGTNHAVTLWGLAAGATYTWRFSAGDAGASGTITAGALPSGLDDLSVTVTGAPVAVSTVLAAQTCGAESWLLMLDGAGDVVWYESAGTTGIVGYTWTSDGTILYGSGQTEVHELTPDGASLYTASGFDLPLHHDLTRGGRYVYALNADEHDGAVVDGLYVLDGDQVVATWDLADHVTVTPTSQPSNFWERWFPGAEDWSHGNSVWSDGERAILSLRWQDAVLEIGADPESADFGQLHWILTGTAASALDGDFTWTDGGGFDGQHHATPTDDGVALFDNRAQNLDSRAVRVTLDAGAGTASEAEAWSVGEHCDIQGGAFPLDGGGVLATCATAGRIQEFAAGDPDAVWTAELSCGAAGPGGPPTLARGVPVP